ncbi:MAG: hypothetical protein ACR2G0_03000 [Chthoniobacterales bacterium]
MRTVLTLLLLSASLLFAQGEDLPWKKYANARFGFVLTYPATLVAEEESMNGDGRTFHSPNGDFQLTAMAHFFVPDSGDSFEGRWQEELKIPNVNITYKKKTPSWYVVSGVTQDGTEFYHKLMRKSANWVAFHITYPHSKNKIYDLWVTRITQRFVPFRDGDFDRLE